MVDFRRKTNNMQPLSYSFRKGGVSIHIHVHFAQGFVLMFCTALSNIPNGTT